MINTRATAFVQLPVSAQSGRAARVNAPRKHRLQSRKFVLHSELRVDRRVFLRDSLAVFLGSLTAAFSASRTDWGAQPANAEVLRHAAPGYELHGDYHEDATQVVQSMRTVTRLERGTPGMKEKVDATRKQMNDFVALYRRNPNVAGAVSFSTLYTAINTLAGHFASYGSTYPVPEKRKKRLEQQLNDVERALSRGR
jgi:photosystem II Psb27 protein